jgi:anti-sigma regulatory factor (Ser/Thr protein kinase)
MRNGTAAVAVEDQSQVGEARRVAMRVAADAGFDEHGRSDVGIVATEAATNVVRHAGRGEVLISEIQSRAGRTGIELVCVDRGPGMSDVDACMRDGYSSGGTMGGGFGAMRRLADGFSIYSAPGVGTALVCRFWEAGNGSATAGDVTWAGVAVPVRGESECGDAWTVVHLPTGTALLVADGLGHGASAANAASEAVRIFRAQTSLQPEHVLGLLHAGLRSTRGAAAAVALIDGRRHELRYAGVGNISAVIVTGDGSRNLVSHNGTLGLQMRKTQEFIYPWSTGALLVAHSDGLATHWKLDQYPGLYRQDPAIIAGILYRDHARPRDDVSVVVCRLREPDA